MDEFYVPVTAYNVTLLISSSSSSLRLFKNKHMNITLSSIFLISFIVWSQFLTDIREQVSKHNIY